MTWNFDPVAISFLGLKVYWYGILFVLAIISGLQAMKVIYRKEKMPTEHLYDQLFNLLIGIILGARLANCLFYYPQYYWNTFSNDRSFNDSKHILVSLLQ